MEPIPISRKRIRNRKRKRHGKNKRLDRDRLKVEVRSVKRQKVVAGCSVYITKDKLIGKPMEATAFWENYTTAQKWQETHKVIWWKTRCQALEQENEILRDTVRNLARRTQCHCQQKNQVQNQVEKGMQNEAHHQYQIETQNELQNEAQRRFQNRAREEFHIGVQNNDQEAEAEDELASDNESLEFELNDDMMDFLKQSMQHKLELKQKRKEASEREEEEVSFQEGASCIQERTENAKLLYGEASPKILGMEAALQTTIDRHKEKARPQYWPNIPLKL